MLLILCVCAPCIHMLMSLAGDWDIAQHIVQEGGLWSWTVLVQILALLLLSYMTLGKLINLFWTLDFLSVK